MACFSSIINWYTIRYGLMNPPSRKLQILFCSQSLDKLHMGSTTNGTHNALQNTSQLRQPIYVAVTPFYFILFFQYTNHVWFFNLYTSINKVETLKKLIFRYLDYIIRIMNGWLFLFGSIPLTFLTITKYTYVTYKLLSMMTKLWYWTLFFN